MLIHSLDKYSLCSSPALGARETKQFKELTVSWVRHTSQQVRWQIQWQTRATVYWGLASQRGVVRESFQGELAPATSSMERAFWGRGARVEGNRAEWPGKSHELFGTTLRKGLYHICHYLGKYMYLLPLLFYWAKMICLSLLIEMTSSFQRS